MYLNVRKLKSAMANRAQRIDVLEYEKNIEVRMSIPNIAISEYFCFLENLLADNMYPINNEPTSVR
jgi:hypothetical protein